VHVLTVSIALQGYVRSANSFFPCLWYRPNFRLFVYDVMAVGGVILNEIRNGYCDASEPNIAATVVLDKH
jgi:hypothetical protein